MSSFLLMNPVTNFHYRLYLEVTAMAKRIVKKVKNAVISKKPGTLVGKAVKPKTVKVLGIEFETGELNRLGTCVYAPNNGLDGGLRAGVGAERLYNFIAYQEGYVIYGRPEGNAGYVDAFFYSEADFLRYYRVIED